MRPSLLSTLFIALLLLVACDGPPPTLVVMEVTRVVIVTPTPSTNGNAQTAENQIATEDQTEEPTLAPTPTDDPLPTPVVGDVYVAEQRFQNGRMFWLQPVDQLWVIVTDEDGNSVWSVYDDTFEDGQIEFDPSLTPPEEGLVQPIRGFGKLWRENPEVREKLGWAIEDEVGHVTRYEYHTGGSASDDGEFITGPGYHIVESIYGDTLRFNEGAWTWQLGE